VAESLQRLPGVQINRGQQGEGTAVLIDGLRQNLVTLNGDLFLTGKEYYVLHDESSDRFPGMPNWTTWLNATATKGVDPRRGPVFGSIYLAIEAALAGHGVAMGIGPLVEQDLRSGRLVRPFELELANAFSFWIVCPETRANDPIIRKFRGWLHKEAATNEASPA